LVANSQLCSSQWRTVLAFLRCHRIGVPAQASLTRCAIEALHLQIGGRPEQGAVQAFAPNGADQPFNEWVRERRVRDGLNLLRVKDPKIPVAPADYSARSAAMGSTRVARRTGP
jgi:hypothetical protein